MKLEYLFFNLFVLFGPLIFSFDKNVYFYSKWKLALTANIIVLIPFILWDSLAADIHWWFNSDYILDFRLLHLPLGEWLFFISVPFACLFIWEVLSFYLQKRNVISKSRYLYSIFILGVPIGLLFFLIGKYYTGLVSIALATNGLLDRILDTKVFLMTQTYIFIGIVTLLIFVFNGYLTARPVVLYDMKYQLGFRIWTVPIEDYFYGFSLITMNLSIYQKLKEKFNG